jgi:hypothetical protein
MPRRGYLFLLKARRLKNASLYEEAGEMFRKSLALSPGGDFGWLAEWYHTLPNVNLAILVEIMNEHEKVVFDASKCIKPALVTDELIIALVKNVSSLRQLRLNRTGITDVALLAISKGIPDLDTLEIHGLPFLISFPTVNSSL